MKKVVKCLLYVIGFLFFGTMAYSQGVTTATISGSVTDEKHEVLPGANITLIHEPSGTRYGSSSRANGQFTVANVRTGGPYTISISFVGYETSITKDIYLALGQESEINISLKVTGVTIDEVVVSAKADPIFNVDHNGAATNISNERIKSIPSINRSLSDMTRLTPQGSASGNFAGRNNLYNNLSINGSLFNNAFGLSGSLGGQTNSQPISIDAIEEIQVSLSPYDVRQSGFTGAGINAITRSGTNNVSGSVYRYQRNQNFVGKKVEGTSVTLSNFDFYQQGLRFAGPIIKDKLFFFVSAEMERRSEPAHNFLAARPGLTGGNVTTVNASTLDSLRAFLIEKYNYDPGIYENIIQKTYSDKVLVRLDYNINQHHKVNVSYNYLKSWRNNIAPSSRAASKTELWFSNNGYKINNNINSIVAELNSNFGNRASNSLIVGYSAFRDFREMPSSPFPMVEISRSGSVMTTFGIEQYTPNNRLNTNVIQVSDNFMMYLGPHTLTLGGSYENYKFENGFTPQYYGDYQYNSLSDFYSDANGNAVTNANSSSYTLNYSAVKGVKVPIAKMNVAQIGFYAQDEIKVNKQLKVTVGVRADIPSYPVTLPKNSALDTAKFINADGALTKIDVSQLPAIKVMWAPRVGFNWDVFGNKKTQVRGGIGLFTGRIPFVWLSNQASNNGILFGQINLAKGYAFSADVNKNVPETVKFPSSFAINATDPNFKFPQVMRANLAVDQKMIAGIVGTLEGMYTRDINAVYIANYNLPLPTSKWPDGRSIYPAKNKINSSITNAYVIRNTSLGYSYFLTAQLQKSFVFNHSGFDLMAAYTYSETKDVNSGGSATASGLFTYTPVKSNPNKPDLSWSDWDQPQKLVAFLNFHTEYMKHFGTAVSLVYTGLQNGRFSYTYTGTGANADFNNDGVRGNDLIYIPNGNDINLISKDDRSVAQVWTDLNAYINQDGYLKKHKGQIMDRNGAVYPWVSQFDLKLTQDFFMNVAGKRNTLQLSLDIINVGNMLNSAWGVKKSVNRASLLNYEGKDAAGNPQFSFPYFDAANKKPLASTFSTSYGLSSLYQFQFGIRYIFN